MRHCGWLLGLLSLFSLATHASDWQEIKNSRLKTVKEKKYGERKKI